MDRSDCPKDPDDTAERYCMNSLQPAEREAFDRHVQRCQPCARILRDTKLYIEAMRSAAKDIREHEKGN